MPLENRLLRSNSPVSTIFDDENLAVQYPEPPTLWLTADSINVDNTAYSLIPFHLITLQGSFQMLGLGNICCFVLLAMQLGDAPIIVSPIGGYPVYPSDYLVIPSSSPVYGTPLPSYSTPAYSSVPAYSSSPIYSTIPAYPAGPSYSSSSVIPSSSRIIPNQPKPVQPSVPAARVQSPSQSSAAKNAPSKPVAAVPTDILKVAQPFSIFADRPDEGVAPSPILVKLAVETPATIDPVSSPDTDGMPEAETAQAIDAIADTPTQLSKVVDSVSDNSNTDDNKPDDNKPDDNKPEDNKPEESKAEESKAEESNVNEKADEAIANTLAERSAPEQSVAAEPAKSGDVAEIVADSAAPLTTELAATGVITADTESTVSLPSEGNPSVPLKTSNAEEAQSDQAPPQISDVVESDDAPPMILPTTQGAEITESSDAPPGGSLTLPSLEENNIAVELNQPPSAIAVAPASAPALTASMTKSISIDEGSSDLSSKPPKDVRSVAGAYLSSFGAFFLQEWKSFAIAFLLGLSFVFFVRSQPQRNQQRAIKKAVDVGRTKLKEENEPATKSKSTSAPRANANRPNGEQSVTPQTVKPHTNGPLADANSPAPVINQTMHAALSQAEHLQTILHEQQSLISSLQQECIVLRETMQELEKQSPKPSTETT